MKLAYTVASFHKILLKQPIFVFIYHNQHICNPWRTCVVFIYAHTTLGEHKERDEGPV